MAHFKGEIIQTRHYHGSRKLLSTDNLRYRDVSEILRERGSEVWHTTVYRWVLDYSQIVYSLW